MQNLSMDAITLARLKALDTLSRPQEVAQLVIIIDSIKAATLDELNEFEKRLWRYRGRNRKDLIATVKFRKTFYPLRSKQQSNSKSLINPKETSTHGNKFSFWRFLPFWNSSQKRQYSPKIDNKQGQISEKTQQMQSRVQHESAKKIQNSLSRSNEPTLLQPLIYEAVDSVEDGNIVNSRGKQKKSWIDYMRFSSKSKEP